MTILVQIATKLCVNIFVQIAIKLCVTIFVQIVIKLCVTIFVQIVYTNGLLYHYGYLSVLKEKVKCNVFNWIYKIGF